MLITYLYTNQNPAVLEAIQPLITQDNSCDDSFKKTWEVDVRDITLAKLKDQFQTK